MMLERLGSDKVLEGLPMPIERRRKPSGAALRSEVSFERATDRMSKASVQRDGMGNPAHFV